MRLKSALLVSVLQGTLVLACTATSEGEGPDVEAPEVTVEAVTVVATDGGRDASAKSCCICRYQTSDVTGKAECDRALAGWSCDVERSEPMTTNAACVNDAIDWTGCTGNRTFLNACHGCSAYGGASFSQLSSAIADERSSPNSQCRAISFSSTACSLAEANSYLASAQSICRSAGSGPSVTCTASQAIVSVYPDGEVASSAMVTVCGGGTLDGGTTTTYQSCSSPPPSCGSSSTQGTSFVCQGTAGLESRTCCGTAWVNGTRCPSVDAGAPDSGVVDSSRARVLSTGFSLL